MKTITNINRKIATYYNAVMFRLRERLKCEEGGVSTEQAGLIVVIVVILGVILAAAVPAFKDVLIPSVLNKITDMFNFS